MILSSKQKWSIARSIDRLNIWEGSVRSTKTVGSTMRFIQAIPKASKDGDIFLIGKTLDSLKRNVIGPMGEYLGRDFMYFPGKREIHLWKRVIYTIGANDERAEGKIRGSTASLVYGDEVTLWPESFFKMLDSRMSLDDSIFFGTTNADNPNHYIKVDYLDRRAELDMAVFKFILDDNPFISDKVKNTLKKNYTGLWYRRFILGLWCVAEGAIHDFFDEALHTLKFPPKAAYFDVTIDYGTGNPTAMLLMGNRLTLENPYVWAEDEYYYDSKKQQKQKTDSEYSVDLFNFVGKYTSRFDKAYQKKFGIEKFFDLKQQRIKDTPFRNIYIDPSALSLKTQLKLDGFSGIREADNTVLDGVRTTSRMLKNNEFAICKACKNYIREMYAYVWDARAQEKGIDQPKKANDHSQDAGRYHIHTKYGSKRTNLKALTKW